MTTVRLPYTVEKRGNLFWQPTAKMQKLGFLPKALGPNTPENQARALKLYDGWLQFNAQRGRVTSYPPGTFGAYWDRMRGRADKPSTWWRAKELRTRQDYERAWVYIDAWRPDPELPTLSRTVVSKITTDICEQFFAYMEATTSPSERWRTIKALKILLDDMVVRLRLGYASPAKKLVNPQPAGRSAIWLASEIEELSIIAEMLGFEGMSLGIRLAWSTMFSPVDIWSLPAGALRRDPGGYYLQRDRTKTEAEAFGEVPEDLARDLLAYMARQPFTYTDATPILRQRNGNAYRSKDTFGDDFRTVRSIAFPEDTRQFMDIRRSANVEADASGADKKTMGELLANGLADSRFLDRTYTPPTVTKAREVALQRLQGREKLAAEVGRLRAAK